MRINSSQYQNIQYLLQKTLAQTAAVTGEPSQGTVSKMLNANTLVEKSANTVTVYGVDKEGNRTIRKQMDADTSQGRRLTRILRLDEAAPQADAQAAAMEDARGQALAVRAGMNLVNYLA